MYNLPMNGDIRWRGGKVSFAVAPADRRRSIEVPVSIAFVRSSRRLRAYLNAELEWLLQQEVDLALRPLADGLQVRGLDDVAGYFHNAEILECANCLT